MHIQNVQHLHISADADGTGIDAACNDEEPEDGDHAEQPGDEDHDSS